MRTSTERSGLIYAALCAINGAFVPAIAKLTTNMGSAFFVATSAASFGGLAAAAVLLLRGDLHLLVDRQAGPRLALSGALGTAAAFFLFFWGAQQTSAIESTLCLQAEPVYSLFLTWFVLGQRPTRRRIAATIILLCGITLALGAGRMRPSLGVWLLLATPFCWQAAHLVLLRGPSVAPPVMAAGRYVYGGLFLSVAWLLSGGAGTLTPGSQLVRLLPLLAVQGVILSYAGTLTWYAAVVRLDRPRATAIVVPSIPLLSLGATFLLLGEVPSPWQAAGLLLTAAGVLSFVTAPERRHRTPSAARNDPRSD